MIGRSRLLVALSVVVVLVGAGVLWFAVFRERPDPAEVKTTAELLVGSWKMTKCDYPPIAPQVEIILVFSDDGRFETHGADPWNGLRVRMGTYRLEGNTIHFSVGPTDRLDAMTWDKVIEVITEDKLVLVGFPEPNGRPRMELQRTTEKLVAPPRVLGPPGHSG
jgi:hypothetical protein